MRKEKKSQDPGIRFPRTIYKCPVCGQLNTKTQGTFNSKGTLIQIKCDYCNTVTAFNCKTGRPRRWTI